MPDDPREEASAAQLQPITVGTGALPARMPRTLLRLLDERVLVVEDDLDLEPVFRRVLHAVDPELRLLWAKSAREAIQLLQGRPVGFVVADYMLGDMPGSQVQRWLERHAPQVPFAMISALPLSAELLRSDGTRVPFLPKPFSLDALVQFLTRLRRSPH
jgi:DNA-binding response OmpR family regulator